MSLKLKFVIIKKVPKWILSDGKWIIIFPIILLSIPFWIPFFAKFTTFTSVELLGYLGLILRLIGFVMIITGLNDKLKNYTDGGLWGLYQTWWNKRPGQPTVINLSPMESVFEMYPPEINATVNFENLTLEEKITHLFSELESLKGQVQSHEKLTKESINKIKKDLKGVEKLINNEINKIEVKLKRSFIGKIDKEFFGAIAIFLGIIYTSIPEEIFSFLERG